MKETKTESLFALFFEIIHARQNLSVDKLKKRFGSNKTLQRYLTELNSIYHRQFGSPLFEFVDADDNQISKNERFIQVIDKSDLKNRTALEVASVWANMQFVSSLKKTLINETQAELIKKTLNDMAIRDRHFYANIDKKFYTYGLVVKKYENYKEQIDTIYDALLRERRIKVEYQNNLMDVKEHVLRPLSLVVYNNGLYLLAFHEWHQDWQTPTLLRLEGFKKVDVIRGREGEFIYPQKYHPERYFKGDFGIIRDWRTSPQKVVLRFEHGNIASFQNKHWASDQEVWNDSESIYLSFTTANFAELTSWILGYGDQCEVVEPESLRESIFSQLKATIMKYTIKKAS